MLRRAFILAAVCLWVAGCKGRAGEGLAPGNAAPDFELPDLAGISHHLSEYQGKVVLLNFWASWCQPCMSELPALEALQQKLGARNFQVVSVGVDDDPENLRQVKDKYALSYPVLLDRGEVVKARYKVVGFPESFVIDKKGNMQLVLDPASQAPVVRIVGPRTWDGAAAVHVIARLLGP